VIYRNPRFHEHYFFNASSGAIGQCEGVYEDGCGKWVVAYYDQSVHFSFRELQANEINRGQAEGWLPMPFPPT